MVRTQHIRQPRCQLDVVLDHQHLCATIVFRLRRRGSHGLNWPGQRSHLKQGAITEHFRVAHLHIRRCQLRHRDREQRSTLWRVAHLDRAAMQQRKFTCDRQAQSAASEAARHLVSLLEAIEDGGPQLGTDARATVRNLDHDAVPVGQGQRAANLTAVGRELEGVRQQVGQYTLDFRRIQLRTQQVGSLDGERDAMLRRVLLEPGCNASHQAGQIHLRVERLRPARVQVRHLEQIVHVAQERLRVALHGPEPLAVAHGV